jgi:hypothetical protein
LRLNAAVCSIHSKELDSELQEAKTTVRGVLTADDEGLVLDVDGQIDHNLGSFAAALNACAANLEPGNDDAPSIVLEKEDKSQLIVKQENGLNVAIEKKQPK